jgi:hypothetical protein
LPNMASAAIREADPNTSSSPEILPGGASAPSFFCRLSRRE